MSTEDQHHPNKDNEQNDLERTVRAASDNNSSADLEQTVRSDSDATIRPEIDPNATIRSDNNVISAQAEMNPDATIRVEDSGSQQFTGNATIRAESQASEATHAEIDSEATIRADATAQIEIHAFSDSKVDDTSFVLNGVSYKKHTTISEGTGEAQIYLIEKDGVESVLKLYFPNMTPKIDLMNKLAKFNHPGLIKMYEHGQYKVPGSDSTRYFERMEYAAGGTIEDAMPITDEARLKEIVLAVAQGLNYCHSQNIIHKDIKPGNLFFRDKERKNVVISDFGISSLFDEEAMMHMTTQARSAIFAAPEQYEGIEGKIIVTPAVDFYSLGITIMYMWLGENPFKGIKNEFAIMGIKNKGKLNYPENMPETVLTLMRGLTVPNSEYRWGINEIEKWYRGEKVEVRDAIIEMPELKPFYFDPKANKVATTLEELADLCEENPDLGKKYLYRGRISDWLKECEQQNDVETIVDITEDIWPENQDAGLAAAIYKWNPEKPYKDIKGKECFAFDEIAESIYNNNEVYKKKLQDKNDTLYAFLWSKDKQDWVDSFQKFFKEEAPIIALLNVVYFINPTFGYVVGLNEEANTKSILCKDVDEVARAFVGYQNTDDAENALSDGRFVAWLKYQGNQGLVDKVEQIIKTKRSASAKADEILYTIKPDLGIFRSLKESGEENYNLNQQDVGSLLCSNIAEAYQQNNKKFKDSIENNLIDDNGEFNCYFRARGWNNIIDYKKYCFDTSKHKKKTTTYNNVNGAYKLAQALLGKTQNAYYVFDSEMKQVAHSIDDLDNFPKKIVKQALTQGALKEWLSVFFHEDPYLDKNEEFETLQIRYLKAIGKIDSSDNNYSRYFAARNQFLKVAKRNLTKDRIHFILALTFPLIMTALALYSAYFIFENGISANLVSSAFKLNTSRLVILGTIAFPLIIMLRKRYIRKYKGIPLLRAIFWGVIFSNVLVNLAIYGITNYNSYVIYAIPGIIIAALLLFVFYSVKRILEYTNKDIRSNLFAKYGDPAYIEPLFYAFNNKTKFVSSKDKLIKQYADERKIYAKRLWWRSIQGILFFTAIVFTVVSFHPANKNNQLNKLFSGINFSIGSKSTNSISGKWKGTFEGRKAVMSLNINDDNTVEGNIKIFYDTPIEQTIKGKYSASSKTLILTDQKNISFKGAYEAKVSANNKEITGTYTLDKTGGKFPFQFKN